MLTRLINRSTQEDSSKATTLTIRGGGDSEPNILLALMQVKEWTLSEMVGTLKYCHGGGNTQTLPCGST